MASVLSTVAQHNLGQFAGTLVRAGGEGFLGFGYLGLLHKLTGVSLAGLSLMQGMGVQSNEKKEGVKEADQIGKTMKDRALYYIRHHGIDMLKTAAVAGGGAALIFAGSKMGGESLADGLAEYFAKRGGIKYADQQFIAIQFLTSTLMTAGDTVAVLGVIKAIQSITSLKLASNSVVLAKGVASNEKIEGKGGKVGDTAVERAVRILSHDIFDIPKAVAISGIGFGAMALGAYFGGQSIQASVAKLMGCT